MERAQFLALSPSDVAKLVSPRVCVFPINGTRRWFMLEHDAAAYADPLRAYMEVSAQNHVELYELFYQHGITTLVTPIFGADLGGRGDAYVEMAAVGLSLLATHPIFTDFYHRMRVHVRFYGEYERFFAPTQHAALIDQFAAISAATASYTDHRLFFGVCADDPAQSAMQFAVRFHAQHGRVPTTAELIAWYYGDTVAPVDLFIGFDKFSAFDMPFIATGGEDLYFTVSPSPYLNAAGLRAILYDHLFLRKHEETDYAHLTSDDWQAMRRFYRANREQTLGVGALHPHGGYWYPLPDVIRPEQL